MTDRSAVTGPREEPAAFPLPPPTPILPSSTSRAVPNRWWFILTALLALWVAARLGAFDLRAQVPGANGGIVTVPNTFATVDHPFHATRAETLRRALAAGNPLRWIGNHQGGYPVEFYPLGVAWLDVGAWALLLGALPMAAAHKLVVIAIFLAPGLAYLLMARRDGWGLGVGLLGLAGHVAVPGAWWQGGYTELVEWGLVTNVAAAVALLFVLIGLVTYLEDGNRRAGAGAALAAGFAISTNPRSLVALAVLGAGVWLAAILAARRQQPSPFLLAARLATVGVVAAALAAPELISLVRFSDLYYFVHYSGYAAPRDYVRSVAQSLSLPVLSFALGGLVAAGSPMRPVTRAVAVTLSLYVASTLALSFGPGGGGVFEQLETTRLMPFQRLLSLYLAAVALHVVVDRIGSVIPRADGVGEVIQLAVAGLLLLLPMGKFAPGSPPSEVRAADRSLYAIETTGQAATADFTAAIRAADDLAPPGTAILVLGTTISWHQQLWAPTMAREGRPFFYDDWLWDWQTRHVGPFDYRQGHAYPPSRVGEALRTDYLERHGVGAVVVTEPANKRFAAAATNVRLVQRGLFDVYAVESPTPMVTFTGGSTSRVMVEDHRVEAEGTSTGGTAKVRRTWYPRWKATVNGRQVPVTQAEDGYMEVPVPTGAARLDLVYVVDGLDWLARILSVSGFAGAALLLARSGCSVPSSRDRRWLRVLRRRVQPS